MSMMSSHCTMFPWPLRAGALLAASSCGGENPACLDCGGISFNEITPAATARLPVGDSLLVGVRLASRVAGAPPALRWKSERPAVARIDTTVPAGARAMLRAVSPGTAVVTVTILYSPNPVTLSLPVTVTAAP
jgi:hypothetical protein